MKARANLCPVSDFDVVDYNQNPMGDATSPSVGYRGPALKLIAPTAVSSSFVQLVIESRHSVILGSVLSCIFIDRKVNLELKSWCELKLSCVITIMYSKPSEIAKVPVNTYSTSYTSPLDFPLFKIRFLLPIKSRLSIETFNISLFFTSFFSSILRGHI
jgi:hypothetical protein